MPLKRHFKLLLFATIAWLIFLIIGLPNYYLDWPFHKLLNFCIVVYFVVGFIIYRFTKKHGKKLSWSLWIAFYITVPLLIYDSFYIRFILKEPLDFMNRFWFLSVFYIIPWIQAPIIYGYVTDRRTNKKSWVIVTIAAFIIAGILRNQWAAFEGSFFDTMSDFPERNVTMLGSSLRYSLYGTSLITGVLSLIKLIFISFRNKT